MSFTKCNDYTDPYKDCGCNEQPDCDCAIKDQSTDCSVYTGDDLKCSGVKKGSTLTKVIQDLDAFICNKFQEVSQFFKVSNVGLGAKVYKGVSNLGVKEFKTLISNNSSVIFVENENEINVTVNQDWLNQQIESYITSNTSIICDAVQNCSPTDNQSPVVSIEYSDGTTNTKTCQL